MLARIINNDRGVTRLMVATMVIACIAVTALLISTTFSEDEGTGGQLSVFYAGPGDPALELRGALLAQGDGTAVTEVTFVLAIPEGGEPVNFTAPPANVVAISYKDKQQLIVDAPWSAAQYGAGDDDWMLEPGENFRVSVGVPHVGPGTSFAIEVATPDGKALIIERTLPEELSKVVNLG